MRAILFIAVLAAAQAWAAQPEAFPFGDPKLGQKVLEAKCTSCHMARFGGDGSGPYTRAPLRVTSAPSLLAWVQRCSAGNKLDLNREEEESVAAYLNERYYRFK